VKYLSQLIRQFGREDRAIAAYNGGPARIGRAGGLPLETLQYVLGVGQFRTLLKLHDASLRRHASLIRLTTVQDDEDWAALSFRLGVQEWELRLHNAFLSQRRLQPGQLIAYPIEPRSDLFRAVDGAAEYRVRYGDNYLHLALTLGVDPDAMREANGLWHIQSVPVGTVLRVPLAADRNNLLHTALGLPPLDAGDAVLARATPTAEPARAAVVPAVARRPSPPAQVAHVVKRGDTLADLAARYGTTVRALQGANGLARRTTIRIGQRLMVPAPASGASATRVSQPNRTIAHRVTRGQTLGGLASRYGTTIRAIQQSSGLANRTAIRIGEVLRIPVSSAE
jgi:LysM repeat protein